MKAQGGGRPGNGDFFSSTAEGYRLTGPSLPLDPRLCAFRRDLADISLAGRIIAPHYSRPVLRACGAHATYVRADPDPDSPAISELLPGEPFAVLEYAGGWAWGYCGGDHLVGYVEAIGLTEPVAASHVVCEKCAPVTADRSIVSPILATLPMGAVLTGHEEGACLCTEYGCVSLSHLRRIGETEDDPVVVAERFMGVPHHPGGRSYAGIDGPGLVQIALSLCGIAAPRLADALKQLGEPIGEGDKLRRGDVVIVEGDAGLMVDDLLFIHACPAAGKVTVDPISLAEGAPMERRRLNL
jgi:hypothetical protein